VVQGRETGAAQRRLSLLSSNELSHLASVGVTAVTTNDRPQSSIVRDFWNTGAKMGPTKPPTSAEIRRTNPNRPVPNDGADPANTNGRRIFAKRTHCDRTGGWKSKIPNAFGGRG
jgi:hypothetical protein